MDNTAYELAQMLQAQRGQDPIQPGITNNYLPPPPAQLFGQAMDAMNDPRLGMLFPAAALRGQASKIAINPSKMDPRRFMTVTERSAPHEMVNFPQDFRMMVTMPEPVGYPPHIIEALKAQSLHGPFQDGMKGLNPGHALRRAADNWPDATEIRIIGKEANKK